jgi:large subunit ribosomal protein L11
MGKKVIALIRLALSASKASPAPPIGPALGQHGINIANFCKEYNLRTADKIGLIIPVEISVYEDKSFTFILKTPPASVLILKMANINKGSSIPNKICAGYITKKDILEIALLKINDLNTKNINSVVKIIEGTARNMGIIVT